MNAERDARLLAVLRAASDFIPVVGADGFTLFAFVVLHSPPRPTHDELVEALGFGEGPRLGDALRAIEDADLVAWLRALREVPLARPGRKLPGGVRP
jgi:hypothetical protein